jgi:4-amino-4-deoxychorismate lyase
MANRSEIVVVTLDGEIVEPGRPMVFGDDPMFTRGDGVFETLLVRGDRACLLDAHLARLGRSAAITGLPAPHLGEWRRAVATAVARWAGGFEAVLRLSYGRGRGAGATAFVTVSAIPARVRSMRRDGVSAMTLNPGVAVGDGVGGSIAAPWSTAGAKSQSYAVNAAALRHAERLGFGDAVLVSADGYVLEGPRSSVLILDGDGVLVTPPPSLPILPGTTVAAVFDVARRRGRVCENRLLGVADLLAAQGVWLLSSVTLAARIHTLDGVVLPMAPATAAVAALVDEAVDERW